MRTRITLSICLLLLLGARKSDAQEMFGAANSNYAGQMGMDLNPASIVNAPYRWELHLLSADISAINNYMYLAGNSKLLRKSVKGESVAQDRFTNNTSTTNKWVYNSSFVKYPAFIWSGKKFAFGFHVSTREETSVRNVPYTLANFIKEGFDYTPQQDINYSITKQVKTTFLNWHELSFTGGANLYDQPEAFITAALTLNYNYGLNAVYALINNMQYNSVADTLLNIYNLNAEYAHAVPDNGENGLQKTLQRKGGGWSVSAGVQYYRNRNNDFYNPCKRTEGEKPYDYKIGVSIIDLGYMKYSKNARVFRYENVSSNWYGIDTVKFDSFGSMDSVLQKQFYGNYYGAKSEWGFTVYTPAAASIQFDFPVTSIFYLNATVIQRIPTGSLAVRRSNQVSITPRFETRKLEFAMPISVYDYFRPTIGASLRYGAFTVGSDMLGPFVGLTNTYGADIYFAISIKHFPTCGGGVKGKKPRVEKCKTPNGN